MPWIQVKVTIHPDQVSSIEDLYWSSEPVL